MPPPDTAAAVSARHAGFVSEGRAEKERSGGDGLKLTSVEVVRTRSIFAQSCEAAPQRRRLR